MDTPTPLVDRLRACAALWTAANDATAARLGRTVVNDGGFFARIEEPGASITTATLEKFARFFARAANWPDGRVPEEAQVLAHVAGVSAPDGEPSPDNDGAAIGPSASLGTSHSSDDSGAGFPPVARSGDSSAAATAPGGPAEESSLSDGFLPPTASLLEAGEFTLENPKEKAA